MVLPGAGVWKEEVVLVLPCRVNAGDALGPVRVIPCLTSYLGPGLETLAKRRDECLMPNEYAGLIFLVRSWALYPTVPGSIYFAGPGPRCLAATNISFLVLASVILLGTLTWSFSNDELNEWKETTTEFRLQTTEFRVRFYVKKFV